ncbi:MAG: BatD family protein [Polyangiaceae bacterium]
MRAQRTRSARLALTGALLFCVPVAATVLPSRAAFAQSAPEVTAHLSDTEVEVGEPFSVELKAMSEGGSPTATDPDLRPPSGFSVSGPMISTQSYMQFGAGGRRVQQGIGATWNLVASTPGTFTIPAPSVRWNSQILRATPLTVKVVPQGTRPRKRPGGFLFPGGSPFGSSPFGSNWPFGNQGGDDLEDYAESQDLSLPRAPYNDVFLHAVADKKKVVVGEQVTISVFRYRTANSVADVAESRPMPLTDFLRYPLVGDAGVQTTQIARAGNRRFIVRMLDKVAAFPLHAGSLHTGAFSESYIPLSRRGRIQRTSEDLAIEVVEPPLKDRPPGYRLGDVGRFQVTSLVQPRRIQEGGSVAVTVKVTGAGNFPTSLSMPEKTGIDWLDPEKKETIEAQGGELVGFRSFGYVVRLTKPGTVDLGTIELPYYDPRTRRYQVARSQLGTVEVTPSPTTKPAPSAAPEEPPKSDAPFDNLPPPRKDLSPYSAEPREMLLPGYRFPLAVAAPPAFAVLALAGLGAARRARDRMKERRAAPKTLAQAALADARKLEKSGDHRGAAAAIERAVILAIEDATAIKARGVLKEDLPRELQDNGVAEDIARRAADLLSACDLARFDPLAAESVRAADAQALVSELARTRKS